MSSNESMLSYFHLRRSGRRIDSQETLILGKTDGDTELPDSRPVEFEAVRSSAELAAFFPRTEEPNADMSIIREAGPVVEGNSAVDPRPRKLSNKEKAAMGANRVGMWTRQRVCCPHDPETSVDLWKPDGCLWGEGLNHDIVSVVNKFKFKKSRRQQPQHHTCRQFASFLKMNMRRKGWKMTETTEMPGPGFIKMLPAEYEQSDYLSHFSFSDGETN